MNRLVPLAVLVTSLLFSACGSKSTEDLLKDASCRRAVGVWVLAAPPEVPTGCEPGTFRLTPTGQIVGVDETQPRRRPADLSEEVWRDMTRQLSVQPEGDACHVRISPPHLPVHSEPVGNGPTLDVRVQGTRVTGRATCLHMDVIGYDVTGHVVRDAVR